MSRFLQDGVTGANPAPGFIQHPEHRIELRPFAGTVAVRADNVQIARTNSALLMHETNHAPVYYIPMDDLDASLLRRSAHVTRCPFKGKASYWNLVIGEHEIDNAMWGYEIPYDEMLELAGMVAFYPSKVRIDAIPA